MVDFNQEIEGAIVTWQSKVFDFSQEGWVSGLGVALNVIAASGTTKTLDVTVEASFDKETWFDTGIAFAQATAVTKEILTATKVWAFVRFNYAIAWTGNPTFSFDLFAVIKK